MSRHSDYKPEYAELARNYALLGATIEDIGPMLGVTGRTIKNWKKAHPEFEEAIAEGNKHADSNVIGALYKNALNGNVTAQIFWLKNRQGWRDKSEVEHTGKNGEAIKTEAIVTVEAGEAYLRMLNGRA
jgi:hypothetical protein